MALQAVSRARQQQQREEKVIPISCSSHMRTVRSYEHVAIICPCSGGPQITFSPHPSPPTRPPQSVNWHSWSSAFVSGAVRFNFVDACIVRFEAIALDPFVALAQVKDLESLVRGDGGHASAIVVYPWTMRLRARALLGRVWETPTVGYIVHKIFMTGREMDVAVRVGVQDGGARADGCGGGLAARHHRPGPRSRHLGSTFLDIRVSGA